jgi:diguanylate cyclase (GGDEF)-like protein
MVKNKGNNLQKNVDVNEYCLELELENSVLKEMLYIDTLTGLPNILMFNKTIEDIDNPKTILVDIDAFSEINEYYGRDVGDYVLKEIAKLIKTYADNENMKTFRIGSDEFLLLGSDILDIEKYERIAKEMVTLLKTNEIFLKDYDESIVIDSTIGFCLEDENILNKAQIALEYAKKAEKDFACYLHSMDNKDKYKKKLKYVKIMKDALDNDRVIPYYQPIFNREGKIYKYEALSRIRDTEGKVISPFFFMDTSKKVRLYTLMTKQIIDKSFKKIAQTDKTISINLLARDMMDGNISNYIIEKIREYGIAKQIVFEILEDESIESLTRVENFIKKSKRLGVRIAIDEFGTGYSNFSYLIKLKPDYLKIDGSIIKNIDTDKNSEAIVKAIISFAKTLHIKTIAEFIHSKDVYDKCYELGIDEFQGFYLGEPNSDLV